LSLRTAVLRRVSIAGFSARASFRLSNLGRQSRKEIPHFLRPVPLRGREFAVASERVENRERLG
jgi:hypothetical protein